MTFTVYRGVEHLDKVATCVSLAIDTETLQLQPEKGKLRLIQFGCLARRVVVIVDCFQLDDVGWAKVRSMCTNGERFWMAHNAVFDLGWLQEHGIELRGRVRCTMLASRMLNNGIPNLRHGLDAVVLRYLKKELSKEQQKSDWGVAELSEDQLTYAAKDVEVLLELDRVLEHRLAESRLQKAYALECKALPALAQMWRTGLPWNREALQQVLADYEFDIQEIGKDFLVQLDAALPEEHKLPRDEDGSYNLRAKDEGAVRLGTKRYAGFNINSPKQLIGKFTAILGTPPLDPATGKPSAKRQALREYAADHEVVGVYLAWKRAEKRRQMVVSLLEHMDADGVVRSSYMQLGADTGRMSCREPNTQQIPRDENFRACVEAPQGWVLVDADFSQMELRLAAAVAGDVRMIEGFRNGDDPHDITAEALGCTRQIAKSANFGLLYGSGAKGLRNYAGGMGVTITLEEAAALRQRWLETYQGIADWQQEMGAAADASASNKWAETRIPGTDFRRYLPGEMNRLTVRCNTPIQGAGAAILKCALGRLWPLVKEAGEETVKIAACVHDEVLLLVREGQEQEWAATLKRVMEEAEAKWLGEIPALAEVHTGTRWSETH
jgi:DNA polymerase-1